MKITTFNPLYTTNNIDDSLARWGKIGFKEKHLIELPDYQDYILENEAGNRIDMVQTDLARYEDLFALRMNVDDFEEGKAFLKSLGFNEESETFKATFAEYKFFKNINDVKIILVHHIK